MKILQIIFDLVFLLLSLPLALVLRRYLPFGEPIYVTPSVNGESLLLLAVIWTTFNYAVDRLSKKLTRKQQTLILVAVGSGFSIIEFFILKTYNQSLSRLYMPLFWLFNLAALGLSRISQQLFPVDSFNLKKIALAIFVWIGGANQLLRKYYVEVIVAILASLPWVVYITRMGLTLSSDSMNYLETALNLSVNGKLEISPHWPPLYPMVLSAAQKFTEFPADGAVIVSAASIFFFFLVFALLIREYSKATIVNLLLITLLATLYDFVYIFRFAWSEQIFSVLLISNFYLLVRHQKEHNFAFFIGAVILAGLGMVTRYIGISMGIILIAYSFLFKQDDLTISQRIKQYVLPACMSFIPFAVLVLWNYSNIGTGIGYSIQANVITDSVVETFLVFEKSIGYPYLLSLIFLLLFDSFAFFSSRKSASRYKFNILKFVPLLYIGLTLAATVTTSARPQVRYFSLYFFFIFLEIAYLIDKIRSPDYGFRPVTQKGKYWLIGIISVMLLSASYFQSWQEKNDLNKMQSYQQFYVAQRKEGFDISATAKNLTSFFDSAFALHDYATFFVIEGDKDYRTMLFESDFRLSKAFFFRRSIFESPGFDKFVFSSFDDDHQLLTFNFHGTPKELRVLPVKSNSFDDLYEKYIFSEKMGGDGENYIIVNEVWYKDYSEDFFGDALENVQLVATAEPYFIFVIVR